MAKSLGQIHTVDYEFPNLDYSLAANNKLLVDLPGQLTLQLQHMVRAMSNFKVVGIDMSYTPILGTPVSDCQTTSMSGYIKYYAPTRGRVEACKMAYQTVRKMMKMSGVNPAHAITYDFRPVFADPADYQNGDDFGNQASIEDNGLATCLANGPVGSSNIFGIYNQGIIPRSTAGLTPNLEEGFDIGLRSNASSADWTLNEEFYLESKIPTANETPEQIPFELSWTAGGVVLDATPAVVTSLAATDDQLQWRPDPALYLSVMTGQLSIEIDTQQALDEEGVDASDATQLNVSVHVAGWKGFLGNHKKKTRRKKRRR